MINILKYIETTYLQTPGYYIFPAHPATGILYVTVNNPTFISGHLRMRGEPNGSYPTHYLKFIDRMFGTVEKTIEVCSGRVPHNLSTFTVDINPDTYPGVVADGTNMPMIRHDNFERWRCDPPYSLRTAKEMYNNTELPDTMKLLKEGARVIKKNALMFLLLGCKNYQWCPAGVKRIGIVLITIVPNNEIRALNIYMKL